jgi:hypothetical protein
MLGAVTINGVLARGLPNTSNFVDGMCRPAFAASPP